MTSNRQDRVVAFFAIVVSAFAANPTAAKEMKQIATVSVETGMINDSLAFDAGIKLAYVYTGADGNIALHVGAPGAKTATTDLSKFSVTPERIHFLGGHWWVVANEGERKVAVVTPAGKIKTQIGSFGDAQISTAKGKAFVTVTEHPAKGRGGRAYDIAAYRPDGGLIGQKQMTVESDERLTGATDLTFLGFTSGYLQALVRKSGSYNAKTDVRGPTLIAVYDVLSGRAGAGKPLPNIPRFLTMTQKRNERPGVETFVRLDDDGTGLELVGPAEKLRAVALPVKFGLYEATSLQQQMAGGKLIVSLTVDPLNADQVAAQKKGARRLDLFAIDLGSAKAGALGEIPLGETQQYAWAAGGNKVAVLKKTFANGGTEIAIFAR